MSPVVAIVDYGRGNLFSVARALESVGAAPRLSTDAAEIARAERLVLPGVGAFGDAMAALRAGGLADAIREFARSGRPLFGICLGAQLLLGRSHEFGLHDGLALIPGEVRPLPQERDGRPKVPNVGWCRLHRPEGIDWKGTALDRIVDGDYAYFVHSFHAAPRDEADTLAVQKFGAIVSAAVVGHGNVFGCQFHPEKSGAVGHSILSAWLAR